MDYITRTLKCEINHKVIANLVTMNIMATSSIKAQSIVYFVKILDIHITDIISIVIKGFFCQGQANEYGSG